MKTKYISFLTFLVFAYSCGSDKPVETVATAVPVQDSVKPQEPAVDPNADLAAFRNMEIVDYCVLIPAKEYEEDFDKNDKANHTFMHKTKKNNEIDLQGLLRANSDTPIEQYFASSLEDAQLEGKVIQKKELLKGNNCFYTKGYWNNSINELRFIEICWLRRDDVVKYYSSFDIADTTIWNERLASLLQTDSYCK